MPPKLDLSKLPWQKVMTSEPIEQLLRAQPVTPGQRNQEERTNAWKDAKIAELSFLGLTSALLAGALSSSLSWTALADLHPWVKGAFVSSLILVVTSISLATQQATVLYRLAATPTGMDRLRESLGHWSAPTPRPRRLQILIWQMPAALLTVSLILFGLGLLVQVYQQYVDTKKDKVVMILSTIAMSSAFLCYTLSYIGLYTTI